MRERMCCFTGHRDLPLTCWEEIAEKLEETITRLVQDGIQFYRTGGALGFDTLAAQTVLREREVPTGQAESGTPVSDPNTGMGGSGCERI